MNDCAVELHGDSRRIDFQMFQQSQHAETVRYLPRIAIHHDLNHLCEHYNSGPWAASGMIVSMIVRRCGDGLNGWAGWLPRCSSQFLIIIRRSAVQDLLDGSPYDNHGVHIIRMHRGKLFEAAPRVNEALAAPILS
jgi:hypothetical protein